jgi:hypothetical protein
MADERHVWQESTSFFLCWTTWMRIPLRSRMRSAYTTFAMLWGIGREYDSCLTMERVPGRVPPPRMAGAHQLAELNNLISAGTSRARTTVESMSIASATPNPNVLTMRMSPDAKPADTRIRTNAALVIIRPDFYMPTATAWVLSPVASYSSLTLLRRKTS